MSATSSTKLLEVRTVFRTEEDCFRRERSGATALTAAKPGFHVSSAQESRIAHLQIASVEAC